MADTKPKFFEALGRAGFKYTRLSDGLMRPVRPIFAICFLIRLYLLMYYHFRQGISRNYFWHLRNTKKNEA